MSLFFMLKKKRRWFLPTPKFIEPLKLDDLKHNNYLPSCSSEIQQLVSHSSENSLTFLIKQGSLNFGVGGNQRLFFLSIKKET